MHNAAKHQLVQPGHDAYWHHHLRLKHDNNTLTTIWNWIDYDFYRLSLQTMLDSNVKMAAAFCVTKKGHRIQSFTTAGANLQLDGTTSIDI